MLLILGETFESLKFLYRISAQSIGKIVPETCQAIVDALMDEYLKVSNQKTLSTTTYMIVFNSIIIN